MVCNPAANNINIADPGPGPSIPGLGLPFSVPKTPFPDIQIPEGIPEDLNDLIERIFALFPASIKFQPNTDGFTKDVWDVLASLFNQLAPFLGFYKFIQALLNIILCIIDILCALTNPFALIRAMIRLFKRCLPDFLSLFPWIALIVMILALVLLLIALIQYLIQTIIAYIKQIIENIQILIQSITKADQESILAAVNKLAYLLCMIEQLFSLLTAISAIFAVIRPLMGTSGRGACAKGDDGCCNEDFCPTFISGAYNGRTNASGRLIYFNQISPAFGEGIPSYFSNLGITLRNERWQFVDDDPADDFRFIDIITPSPSYGFTYWPEGEVYSNDANVNKVPYLMDMHFFADPSLWGNPSDMSGFRQFYLQDVIISNKPTVYPKSWNNGTEFTDPISGSFNLVGGIVYEYDGNDGYTQYFINGLPATIETFLHKDDSISNEIPSFDDGYNFVDINYNLRFNSPVLIDKSLITLACNEDVAAESAVFNSEFSDLRSVFDKLEDGIGDGILGIDSFNDLPDVDGAISCLSVALAKFRSDINTETAAVFQAEVEACLGDLLDESQNFYVTGTVIAGDRFSSDFTLDPDLQFVNNQITLNVILRDRTGTQLAVNLDDNLGNGIAKTLTAKVTFGTITDFTYDGYGSFNAYIYSTDAGSGEARAFLNGEVFAEVLNRDDDDTNSEIVDRILPYEFIDKASFVDSDLKNRYGVADIAEDGS